MVENKRAALKDKPWLPVILWLAPVIVLNLSFEFISHINFSWAENSRNEYAQNEVESLGAASDYSYQFSKTASKFKRRFIEETKQALPENTLTARLKRHEKELFKSPFPAYGMFVFKLPKVSTKASIIMEHWEGKAYSKLAAAKTFELLCALEKNDADALKTQKANIKWFKGLLGKHTLPEILKAKKGQSTFVLWQNQSAWFIYDSFCTQNGDIFGYYLLTPNLTTCADDARRMALSDYKQKETNKKSFAAFINVFDKNDSNLVPKPLLKSRLFKRYAESLVSDTNDKRFKYLKKEPPKPLKLGNYYAYAFLPKSSTHMAVCLFRELKKPLKPWYIKLITVAILFFITLTMVRGMLLSEWPHWGLKLRFLMIYFLLSTLPIALFTVCAAGYLLRYQKASYFETVGKLKNACQKFDSSKQLIANDYQAAFKQALTSKELELLLKQPPSEKRNATIGEVLTEIYKKRAIPLPIMALAIIDANNKIIITTEGSKREATDAVKSFSCFMAELLAEEIKEKTGAEYPPIKKTNAQKALYAAYQSVSGRDLYFELNKRRSFMVEIQAGSQSLVRMHDTIKIDNKPAYMLMAVWNSNSLDNITYNLTLDSLSLTEPQLSFIGCRMSPEPEALPLNKNKRSHLTENFLKNASELAEQAYFRNGTAQRDTASHYMLAMASQKYKNTIFVAGQDKVDIEIGLFKRGMIFLVILCLTLLTAAICSLYSSKLILRPISTLQGALERVSRGNLLTEINSSREDEIGALGVEFSSMIKGLRERQRLSSLISDQAMYAITTAESGQKLREKTFSAVVLSADIRSFTSLNETYEPEQITDMLNSHFAAMAVAVAQYGGQIYKFIGDEIEAVFEEAPDYNESASLRAFYAAVTMLNKLNDINKTRKRKKLFQYKMGIGLCFGRLNSGAVGSDETRLDYALIGKPIKMAAQLEALSKTLSDFPVVFCSKVAVDLKKSNINIIPLKNSLNAYTVKESDQKAANEKIKKANQKAELLNGARQESTPASISLDTATKPVLSFLTALLVLGAGLASIFYLDNFYYDSSLKREKAAIEEENRRLLKQINSSSAAVLAFESNCRGLVKKLESLPINNAEFIKNKLPQILKAKVGNPLKSEYISPALAYFAFSKTNNYNFNKALNVPEAFKCVFCEGFEGKDFETLKKTLYFAAAHAYSNKAVYDKNALDSLKFQKIFGSTLTLASFAKENMSRAYEARLDEGEAFVFCDIITTENKAARLGLFSTTDTAQIEGVLLAIAPSEPLKDDKAFFYVLNAFETPNQTLCKIANQSVIYSSSCPTGIYNCLKNKKNDFNNKFHLSYEDTENGCLAAVQRLKAKRIFGGAKAVLCVLLCAAGFIYFVWRAINKTTILNRSLALKLWLMLLFTSAIPIAAVFVFFQFFIDEDYNVRLSGAKNELNAFINDFELKQYYLNPVLYQSLKKVTRKSKTQSLIKDVERQCALNGQLSPQNNQKLQKWLTDCQNKINGLKDDIYKFELKGAVVGTRFFSTGTESEIKEFLMALSEEAAQLYLKQKPNERKKTAREKLKTEEAFQVLTVAMRTIVGDDFYTRVVSTCDLPAIIQVVADGGMLMLCLGPDEINSEYLCVWVASLHYDTFLHEIASAIYEGRYEALAVRKSRYGMAGSYATGAGRHLMADVSGWISLANLPLTRKVKHDTGTYLLTGRPGVLQSSSVIAAALSLNDIEQELANYKYIFYLVILTVIVLVLYTAKAAASDILAPIKSLTLGMKYVERERGGYRININRNDELGMVCASFNTMMRSLEEKVMIGKMLSKSAMEFSGKFAHESSAQNYVCVFAGICGFIDYIADKSAAEIFADLQPHIAMVSEAIISEGGDIDKIMGEKILAVFKAGKNPSAAANAALRAALKIVGLEKAASAPFSAAIGINYGKIIGGFLGVGKKRDFTVIGDAVNVSARLEALAENLKANRCVISEEAFKLISKTEAEFVKLGEVELKGKAKATSVYTKA